MTADWDRLRSWENLRHAFVAASRGKRRRPDVAAFEHRLEENLISLQRRLDEGSYRPRAYRSFFIYEPKRRLISAAPFDDRVAHHALCRVIEPRFERSFVADSYANRIGKGTHRALAACQRFSRRFRYVLQLDIRKFFPSIDQKILERQIARKVSEKRVMALVRSIVASGEDVLSEESERSYFPGDDLLAVLRPRGLPIGNLTSQFWANVYLDPLDHFIKRELRCRGYARYVDDLLLFSEDKSELWAWLPRIEERLARLRLRLHAGSHPRPVGEGVPFLGFVTYPDRRRLKRRKAVHYRRRLKAMVERCGERGGEIEALRESFAGWSQHCRYGNTVGLRKKIAETTGYQDLVASADVGESCVET